MHVDQRRVAGLAADSRTLCCTNLELLRSVLFGFTLSFGDFTKLVNFDVRH